MNIKGVLLLLVFSLIILTSCNKTIDYETKFKNEFNQGNLIYNDKFVVNSSLNGLKTRGIQELTVYSFNQTCGKNTQIILLSIQIVNDPQDFLAKTVDEYECKEIWINKNKKAFECDFQLSYSKMLIVNEPQNPIFIIEPLADEENFCSYQEFYDARINIFESALN